MSSVEHRRACRRADKASAPLAQIDVPVHFDLYSGEVDGAKPRMAAMAKRFGLSIKQLEQLGHLAEDVENNCRRCRLAGVCARALRDGDELDVSGCDNEGIYTFVSMLAKAGWWNNRD